MDDMHNSTPHQPFAWGSLALDEEQGLEVLKSSYGRDGTDPAPFGHRFTIASDGTVCALVAGDMGYESTHIVIPRDHILALIRDWPEVTLTTPPAPQTQTPKGDRYFLKQGDKDEEEVTREAFIRAERRAGFHPRMSSDHPHYMTTLATAGFSNDRISGRIQFNIEDLT